jgi:hypothetical protein
MQIDKEFKELIPPLSDEERANLEASILAEGCRDALVVWDGILLDGHNRYEICTRHDIAYKVVEIQLPDREAAKDWMDKNQLGRRNLTPDWVRYLIGRRYNRMKKSHGSEPGTNRRDVFATDQFDTLQTADLIAKDHGVAPATVKRAAKFATQVDTTPTLKQALIEHAPVNKVLKAIEYGHDQGDEWYTPRWIFDGLGIRFDMDVCAPVDLTYVTTPAEAYLTEESDGLMQKWHGTVWCNPPYSAPEAWADRCIEHGDGLLLTHIPMNAAWAMRVWEACDGMRLFQAIEFVRPDGRLQRPGSWLMLAAFGDKATKALARLRAPDDVAENPRRVPSPMWVRI